MRTTHSARSRATGWEIAKPNNGINRRISLSLKFVIIALTHADQSRLIEMAWEDRTPFEAIATQYGLNESAVITFIQKQLKDRTFMRWRQRISGRDT